MTTRLGVERAACVYLRQAPAQAQAQAPAPAQAQAQAQEPARPPPPSWCRHAPVSAVDTRGAEPSRTARRQIPIYNAHMAFIYVCITHIVQEPANQRIFENFN